MEFKDIDKIAVELDGKLVSNDDWKDEIIAAFEDSLEVIISSQPDGSYQVYENHPDSPIMKISLIEISGDYEDYKIVVHK